MDIPPSTPAAYEGRKHVGQAIFAADGRVRAVMFEGQRYDLLAEEGAEAAHKVGDLARAANLYIDPQTFALFDQVGNRVAGTKPRNG